MTTTRATDAATGDTTRHPVRRFLIVVATLALVAVLLWWTGLCNPRLGLTSDGGSYNVVTHEGTIEVLVTNHATTPVEVIDARIEGSGITSPATDDGADPSLPMSLGADEQARFSLGFATDGCPPSGMTSMARLVVTTRTVIGVERTQDLNLGRSLTSASCIPSGG